MSKSSCIRAWKNKILGELSQDDNIVDALGLNEGESPDDLVWNRLFPHYYIPETQEEVKTYILVEIDIPERRSRYGNNDVNIWVYPTIIFYVLTHQEDMKLDITNTNVKYGVMYDDNSNVVGVILSDSNYCYINYTDVTNINPDDFVEGASLVCNDSGCSCTK